jgi:hypothetical protein
MNGNNSVPEKTKKPFYKRWWFWILLFVIFIIIAASLGGNGNNNAGTTNSPFPSASLSTKPSAAPSATPTEKTASTVSVNLELSNGNYTSGIDFPAGKYDIEAISGAGNVSSSNMYNGGINATMGTKDANKAIGSDLYEQKYSNIDLPDGIILYISGVTVKITSEAANGSPLKTREQPNTKTVELGNGNFVAGKDFPSGTYDIVAVSGGGNVSSDNMYSGGLNAVMGVTEKNKEIGTNMYQQKYKNIELPDGTTLTISGVDIQLIPSR